MTAKEQLLRAHELGHDLSIEHGQRVVCTCGYRSTMRLSRSALNMTLAWHLGKVISDALDDPEARRNGLAPGARSGDSASGRAG